MTEPRDLSLLRAGEQMRRGALTAEALLLSCLERIEERQTHVQAWVTLQPEQALAAARQMDREAARRRWRGPMHGIPIGVKDIIDVKGMETRAGSEAYENGVASHDAACVARLREAGAIILGKTATTEFAYREPSEARNPWHQHYTPGGSSAGSGAATGDRQCLAALGTQTSGSVLRPAAFNGVVGFKATHGDVSLEGVVPLSWQLDHLGCLTRTAGDAHVVWHLMRTQRELDWQSSADKMPPALLPKAPRTIWRLRDPFEAESSPECLVNLERACVRLEQNGARIVERPLPDSLRGLAEVHQTIMATEAAAYHRERFAAKRHLYSEAFAGLVEEGLTIKGADYVTALRRREAMRRDIAAALAEVDVAIMSSSVTLPPEITEHTTGSPAFNMPWSLCGVPALALPTAVTENNLPLSVQLIAGPGREEPLLRMGAWCESLFAFHASPP